MNTTMTMGERNLRLAIQALREDQDPNNFSMWSYGYLRLGADRSTFCMTPGCVLGHYAARQDLQQSFTMSPRAGDIFTRIVIIGRDGHPVHYDSPAIREHFEITESEAFDLFNEQGCGNAQSPLAAIEYLEAFIARKWPVKAPIEQWLQPAPEAIPA